MGLLDKLKPQPRWKHADPAIRQEAVRELPEDSIDLATLAETDPDVRVRRAAVAQTSDIATLSRVAAGDPDQESRDRASDRLVALATSNADHAAGLAAIRSLTDPRRLSTIAKGDAPEAIRTEALGRLSDERALGAIARGARHEDTARAALDRLASRDECLDVALRSEHKDVALAALDRTVGSDPNLEELQSIEVRAAQKAVSRRARALIQDIEAAEAARKAAEEERRRREAAVCEELERLAVVADVDVARAELERLTTLWGAVGVEADDQVRERFRAAADAVQTGIGRRVREAEEAVEHARQRAEAIATREALCDRVETLEGTDVLEQLVPIEEEWRSLMPLVGNGPEADRLAERFARAVTACRKRHEMSAVLDETRDRLAALVLEAEGLTSQEDQAGALSRWSALSREARGLAAQLEEAARPETALADRLSAVAEVFGAREAAAREALTAAQAQASALLKRLVDRARQTAAAEQVTLREGDRLMRDIKTSLETVGRVESNREIEQGVADIKKLQEAIAPRVRELREMDEWRRFANAQRQEQLIATAEGLVATLKADEEAGRVSDLTAAGKALREMHASWREAAEAPRHSAQRLWERFRTATATIREKCEPHFASLRENRKQSVEAREQIVAEAETLAESTEWTKTAARFQELQQAWREAGPVPRALGQDLARRFRTASTTFFNRRREDMAGRKKVWAENLSKKEALCERAESLAESTDWDTTAAEIKRLQAEWKTIGPIRRQKTEAVWNRFHTACDQFFQRYHNRHQLMLASKLSEREALVVELEGLAGAEAADDVADRVQALRNSWNRGVPVPLPEMQTLTDRWHAALKAVVSHSPESFRGTEMDPAAVRHRLERVLAKVESLLGDIQEPAAAAGMSQTEALAARLRTAFASNAMGSRGNQEAKWRSATDAVKDAQATWRRLAAMAGPEDEVLNARFREVCRRVNEEVRRHTSGGSHGQHSGAGRRAPKPAAFAV